MVIKDATAELTQLLQRSLFLKPELKSKILASTPKKQAEVLPLITKIDEKQTALFKKVLTKNPHFFADLETQAIHQVLASLIEAEEGFRVDEIKMAEKQLNKSLNGL